MTNLDILDDYADIDPFATSINKTPRTVRRYMDQPDGLPFVQLGNRRLIHIPTAKQWLLERIGQRNPTRPRRARRARLTNISAQPP